MIGTHNWVCVLPYSSILVELGFNTIRIKQGIDKVFSPVSNVADIDALLQAYVDLHFLMEVIQVNTLPSHHSTQHDF